MNKVLFFPLFLFIAITLSLIYIPRQQYKKYLIYGAMTGGIGNMIITILMNHVFGVGHYAKIGIFNIFGFNFLEPFAWTFVQMLFLYFLPVRKWFLYAYVLGFVGISVGFGYVIKNLGIIIEMKPTFAHLVGPFIFLTWWSFTAWFFRKIEGINKKEEKII
jgi:hypothetical protein